VYSDTDLSALEHRPAQYAMPILRAHPCDEILFRATTNHLLTASREPANVIASTRDSTAPFILSALLRAGWRVQGSPSGEARDPWVDSGITRSRKWEEEDYYERVLIAESAADNSIACSDVSSSASSMAKLEHVRPMCPRIMRDVTYPREKRRWNQVRRPMHVIERIK